MSYDKIRKDMIVEVLKRAPIGYTRTEADSNWVVVVEKDGELLLGGYAKEFMESDALEDLPLAELGHLLDVPEKEQKEMLKDARECIADESEEGEEMD